MLMRASTKQQQDERYARGFERGRSEALAGQEFDHLFFERADLDEAAGYSNGRAAGKKEKEV